MAKRIWDDFLTGRDKQVLAAAGFGTSAGWGERPVILVIDVNYFFVGDRREPLLEAVKRWPNACGEDGWDALPHIRRLIDAGRAKGVPVIYTTGTMRPDGWDAGSWRWKIARIDEMAAPSAKRRSNLDGNEIVPDIAPAPSDVVIKKIKPSAFHGTPLTSFLTHLKADSVLVVGTTTSGCVRATVIDAFSENYRVAVVEEGCFDRSQSSHAINLCDMDAKYADVVPCDDAIAYIGSLPDDLFELPRGDAAQ